MSEAFNYYERQRKLLPAVPQQVAVIGCGGVGSWLALFLALAGVESLWLFDHDTVTDHNLNRLPLDQSSIGENKAKALETVIKRMRPDAQILCLDKFIPDTFNLLNVKNLMWIVAATDSLKSRRSIYDTARSHGIAYLEIAAEGEVGTVTASPADFATEEEEQPGYQSVPVWVGPCTLAASIAAAHVLHGKLPGTATYHVGWGKNNMVEFQCLNPEAAVAATDEAKKIKLPTLAEVMAASIPPLTRG